MIATGPMSPEEPEVPLTACGCPQTYERILIARHTRECSDRETLARISADIAERYGD
jgi:hypothetical protein